MASITVNFTPSTVGNHIIGYRDQAVGGAYATQVVNVALNEVNTPRSEVIDLGSFNIYCDQLVYECYIIAECQGLSDVSPVDGVPDEAFEFTVNIDPIEESCKVVIYQLDTSGMSTFANLITVGSGYTDGTFTNVPIKKVSGSLSGTGATVTTTISGGIIQSVFFDNPGSGYTVGDVQGDITFADGSDPVSGGAPSQEGKFQSFLLGSPVETGWSGSSIDLSQLSCGGSNTPGSFLFKPKAGETSDDFVLVVDSGFTLPSDFNIQLEENASCSAAAICSDLTFTTSGLTGGTAVLIWQDFTTKEINTQNIDGSSGDVVINQANVLNGSAILVDNVLDPPTATITYGYSACSGGAP